MSLIIYVPWREIKVKHLALIFIFQDFRISLSLQTQVPAEVRIWRDLTVDVIKIYPA